MGYTHYWRKKTAIDDSAWLKFAYDAKRILTACIDTVQAEDGWPDMVTREEVVFNGIEPHETFLLQRQADDFSFCKTNGKPYDVAVTAMLIMARLHFGTDIKVSSDGEWSDWAEGRALVRELFGAEPEDFL